MCEGFLKGFKDAAQSQEIVRLNLKIQSYDEQYNKLQKENKELRAQLEQPAMSQYVQDEIELLEKRLKDAAEILLDKEILRKTQHAAYLAALKESEERHKKIQDLEAELKKVKEKVDIEN